MQIRCQYCGGMFEASPAHKRKYCSRECWKKSLFKRIPRTCLTCGKQFLAKNDKVKSGFGKYCSKSCMSTGRNEPCKYCGKLVRNTPYHAETQKNIFCSRKCYAFWKSKKITLICSECGKEFRKKPSKISKDENYCSQHCYDLARKQKIITLVCKQCGKSYQIPASSHNPNMYRGEYCSNECAGIARRMPDSARSIYTHKFTEKLKKRIRERDGYQCQMCGINQKDLTRILHVHHIDYDKSNSHPDNLISLCHSCHSKTNYNRRKWTKLLLNV